MVKNKFFHFSFLICFFTVSVFFAGCKKTNKPSQNSNQIKKIISLSPASTEILFAVGAGDKIAACSDLSDYPPQVKNLPKVGGFDGKTLSLEAIISYEPDLVYLTNVMHNFLIPQIEQYGIKYYLSYGSSIEDVKKEILDIAELTDNTEKGEQVIKDIETKISNVKTLDKPITVYWEVWNSPFMSIGNSSFINDVIEKSGGKNIFSDIDDSYPIVNEETIIIRAPDVILIPQTSGVTVESVMTRKGWENIPAVKNKKIILIDDNLFTRAGPRIGDCILQLNEILMN